MPYLCEPVLDPMLAAHAAKDVFEGGRVAAPVCELYAIVGQHLMEPVGNCGNQVAQELGCSHLAGLLDKADKGELAGSVNRHKEIQLAFSGLHFGDIDVKEANGIMLELLTFWLVAIHIRQARYFMSLKTAMQGRTRQMGNGWLQGIEAVVQRQQRVAPERHDHCFFLLIQHR